MGGGLDEATEISTVTTLLTVLFETSFHCFHFGTYVVDRQSDPETRAMSKLAQHAALSS